MSSTNAPSVGQANTGRKKKPRPTPRLGGPSGASARSRQGRRPCLGERPRGIDLECVQARGPPTIWGSLGSGLALWRGGRRSRHGLIVFVSEPRGLAGARWH
eukprot:4260100-Prymnesium_polylepis.1